MIEDLLFYCLVPTNAPISRFIYFRWLIPLLPKAIVFTTLNMLEYQKNEPHNKC